MGETQYEHVIQWWLWSSCARQSCDPTLAHLEIIGFSVVCGNSPSASSPEQVVASDLKTGPGYKRLLKIEVESATYLSTAVAFEGYLKYSALFYG